MRMRLGLLKCTEFPKERAEAHGSLEKAYQDLFRLTDPTISLVSFDVHSKHRSLPKPSEVDDLDAFVITGSPNSAYDKDEWISELQTFLQQMFVQKKPLVGICFGHQLIAQALDGEVRKVDPFQIGISSYQIISDDIQKKSGVDFSWLNPKTKQVNCSLSHGDQVVRAPSQATVFLSSPTCPIAGYIIDTRVLTFQCHPEFSKPLITFMLDNDHRKPKEAREKGKDTLYLEPNSNIFCQWIVNWLKFSKQERNKSKEKLLKSQQVVQTKILQLGSLILFTSIFVWIVTKKKK